MYKAKYENVDDDRNDLSLYFGDDPIIDIKMEEVEKIGLDHKTALKFFQLIVNNMQNSGGFKKLLIKSDTLNKVLGSDKSQELSASMDAMMECSNDKK